MRAARSGLACRHWLGAPTLSLGRLSRGACEASLKQQMSKIFTGRMDASPKVLIFIVGADLACSTV